jgi:dTDP-glucose 4,6-dehydratase
LRTLVTGGCGFIGQHLIALLADRDGWENVLAYDLRTHAATGWNKVYQILGPRLIKGGVCDYPWLWQKVEEFKPDLVIHLAAQSHVDASLEDPGTTWRTNALGTQVVAEICAKNQIPLLYCSTDEVYGTTPIENGVPIAVEESQAMNPSSPYSASKAAGELAVHAMGKSAGLKWAVTRGSNAWGYFQLEEKLVPIACSMLRDLRPVPLHGGGLQQRQWVHVEEFAEALAVVGRSLVGGEAEGKTYNIAGPTVCSVRDLVLALAEATGISGEDAWRESGDRPGQDNIYCVSGEALEADLGFKATRNILDRVELASLLEHYEKTVPKPILAKFVGVVAK